MKIIGKTKDGFILNASSIEVANLIGYYRNHLSNNIVPNLKEGDEIQILKMYRQLYNLSYMEKTAKKTREQLLEMAEALKQIDPLIQEITKP